MHYVREKFCPGDEASLLLSLHLLVESKIQKISLCLTLPHYDSVVALVDTHCDIVSAVSCVMCTYTARSDLVKEPSSEATASKVWIPERLMLWV